MRDAPVILENLLQEIRELIENKKLKEDDLVDSN